MGAEVLVYVPGYPITEAAEALGEKVQKTVNEKVALEVALGASATGQRSLVMVKHLGVNLLSDPLTISPTHTIGAGLVVLVAEDVEPKGSQIELDIRHYGALCDIPVLDPAGPGSIRSALAEAYTLSENISAPVMVRSTFDFGEIAEKREILSTELHPPRGKKFDRSIWNLTAKGRHQRYRSKVLPLMQVASESSPLNVLRLGKIEKRGVGIIASGRPARLAKDLDRSLLALGYANPLPWNLIRRFIEEHERVLVLEEPGPFIESQLRMSKKVRGKLTGHLPWGRLEPEDMDLALDQIYTDFLEGRDRPPQTVLERGYKGVCNDCPYLSIYEAVRDLNVPTAGDAGCSIRAVRLGAVDVVYGLGSSIGVASGFKEKGVALIGDYALAHSGLQGLMDALNNRREVLVVLLQNRVAAMTGGQSVPDVTPLLEALLPIKVLDAPVSGNVAKDVLKEELAKSGVSLVLVRGICPRY